MSTSTTRTVLVLCGFRDWFRLDLFGHPFWSFDVVVRRWSLLVSFNPKQWGLGRGGICHRDQVGSDGSYVNIGPFRVTHYPKVKV